MPSQISMGTLENTIVSGSSSPSAANYESPIMSSANAQLEGHCAATTQDLTGYVLKVFDFAPGGLPVSAPKVYNDESVAVQALQTASACPKELSLSAQLPQTLRVYLTNSELFLQDGGLEKDVLLSHLTERYGAISLSNDPVGYPGDGASYPSEVDTYSLFAQMQSFSVFMAPSPPVARYIFLRSWGFKVDDFRMEWNDDVVAKFFDATKTPEALNECHLWFWLGNDYAVLGSIHFLR